LNPSTPYSPADVLYLWYLGRPENPFLVGDLGLVMSARGVSLRYSPEWLRVGFPLSEDLPLVDIEHFPKVKDSAVGAVDDARPDRWGERVIRLLDHPPRLSLLEYLYFAGDDRFGALGVSLSRDMYAPRDIGPLPRLSDVDAIHDVVRKVLAGDRVEERYRRLIAPGATMGGARPKALIHMENADWVLKFAEEDQSAEPLVEHATLTLAAKANITVATTRPIKLAKGVAVAIKRFDRAEGNARLHALSANVALKAAGAALSYPELAQLLRRRGSTEHDLNRRQMRELFRRLLFNILMDNTDDHEKNHALLVTDAQHYVLSPAFDVLPTGQALGYQAMEVGQRGAESSIENALSMARHYGLNPKEAVDEARIVACAVDAWQAHFLSAGVPSGAIAALSACLDRPQLLESRRALIP
jgi:serine/threonine-protein kinase HipA